MWIIFAFISATLLGLYDASKKVSLRNNDVIPVLFLNTLFCSLIFLPLIILSYYSEIHKDSMFYVTIGSWEEHRWILLKSIIVLLSWLFGYFAMAHLPLTIVGPINATRPIITLIGAMIVFGEALNYWQWIGVSLSIFSLFLLSRSGKNEGIYFRHNRWILFLIFSALLGACSGLLDKYLMAKPDDGGVGLERMFTQSWYNLYQCLLMVIILIIYKIKRLKNTLAFTKQRNAFHWKWTILFISVFLSVADFAYFYALSLSGAMISIVSMVRRGSVIVSFVCGAIILRERNLKAKIIDLVFILAGMVFLWIGSC